MKVTGKQKGKIQKVVAFILAMISLAGPCISAATYIKRGYTRNCIMSIEASAKHTKKLPIYCVDTKEKKIALSFDAAWGAVR